MVLRVTMLGLLLTVGLLATTGAGALPPDPGLSDPYKAAAANPGAWRVESLAAADVGQYTSLALDAAGRPHISYYDARNGDLKYATKNASVWRVETVDSVANVGGYTSLALDELGQPNISYCRLVGASSTQCEDLKYAIKLSGVWHTQTVDSGGLGAYSSLAVEGGPNYEDMSQHISYYDQTNQQLKYCWGTGAFWDCDVIDTDGNVGGYTSLALDELGQPNISYCALEGSSLTQCNDLKYAIKLSGDWHTQTVDSVGYVGAYSSLAVEGGPAYEDMSQHIAYYDQTNQQLKYCWGTGAMWDCDTVVDTTGNEGGYASLVLDEMGQPNISYCALQGTSLAQCDDLKYAIKLAGVWHTQTFDSGGYVGAYSSLAVEGGPNYEDMSQHISYYDETNRRLKYCWGTGAMWRCGPVVPPVFLPLVMRG